MTPQPGTRAYGANLTPDESTGIGGWSDEQILTAIRSGRDDQGHPLCPTMPRFADLSPEDGAAIVVYLRAIPPVHHEIPQSECEAQANPSADAGSSIDAGAIDAARIDAAATDAAADVDAASCATWAAPSLPAPCQGCGAHRCQKNGCLFRRYCETVSKTCHAPPPGCS
jgi:hypothetical protein